MTNHEMQGQEETPLSPEDRLDQEVKRMIENPEKKLPKGFLATTVSLLSIHHKLSGKKRIID